MCAHVYTHVHTTLVPGQAGWGGSCILAPCTLPWADGICLVPLLCQVTHPSADLGWGFREGVCFPGLCLMVNPMEMAPAGPSGSLATRPPSAPEPCPLSVAGPGFWLPGSHHFLEGSPILPLCAVIVSPAAGELLTHSLAGWAVSVNQFETRRAAFPQPRREGSVQDWADGLFLPEEPSLPRAEAWPALW